MMNFKKLLTHALLALMLASGAQAALAGPTYHVTLNTAGASGSGLLDLVFLGYATAAPATARLSNFSGDFGAEDILEGDVSGTPDSAIVMGNNVFFNAYTRSVNFGGVFGFDVSFEIGDIGDGMTLGGAFYLPDFSEYVLFEGNVVQFELTAGSVEPAWTTADLGSVTEVVPGSDVPEPASMFLLMTGLLGLAGSARRRRG